ncbi:MAG: PASTA domain-containing protein [Bacteroidetes bacterium]|nr:PASTA domain-containing protein [Bacteroidota bacterium]MCY4204316.1 PASTA domain-containing protein [Bacteroidota bacterium]
MPRFTRQDQIISVPDLKGKLLPDALNIIHNAGLVLGDTTSRIGPKELLGQVAAQNPRANASVKLGRRIYLSTYRGSEPDVIIPDVITQSLRNARLSLTTSGLVVRSEEADTIPSPVPDMVTRILPPAGTLVPNGDSVTVWYGRGLDQDRLVEIPNVVGLPYDEAEVLLRALSLWPTLLDLDEKGNENPLILRQSPLPGERLPSGSTLRLFASVDSLKL